MILNNYKYYIVYITISQRTDYYPLFSFHYIKTNPKVGQCRIQSSEQEDEYQLTHYYQIFQKGYLPTDSLKPSGYGHLF